MNHTTVLTITKAREKIFAITDEVQRTGSYFTLTERGRPKAVVISAEEFASWLETLEVMCQFPELEKDLEKAQEDLKKGRYTPLEELLAQEGFVPDAPNRSQLKSEKRSRQN